MEDVSERETISSDNTTKDDNEEQVENLRTKISKLENETQQFSVQRARMKELFMQKEEEETKLRQANKLLEDELNSIRCQFNLEESNWSTERLKQEEELESLRSILHDTLEESTKREEEVERYKHRILRCESEIAVLKSELSDQKQILAPGAVLTNIVKKVSSLGAPDVSHSQESLDESMRKAQEDAEILKSLLIPLEDQIRELTSKLNVSEAECTKYRLMVDQLRRGETLVNGMPGISSSENNSSGEEVDSFKPTALVEGCDMCRRMEAQLSKSEDRIKELEKQISILERYREELAKEIVTRKQMEEKWNEKKELHKNQVAELQEKLKHLEGTLIKLKQINQKSCSDMAVRFEALSKERIETQEKLDRLQKDNENLVGKHLAHSTELQNATINLPDTVEELQEMCLKLSEDLIKAKVGFERSDESVESYRKICSQVRQEHTALTMELNDLKMKKEKCEKILESKNDDFLKVERKLSSIKTEVEKLKTDLANAHEEKKQLEESELELKNRLTSMQSGLEHGEAIQKDFVLLSQNLQKELEHLRVQNNVLRWEYEEDVMECRGCEKPFNLLVNKTKNNCKHCGRLFCVTCLSHIYKSPITKRPSAVCNLCHTLLDHNIPPYFSTDPPK